MPEQEWTPQERKGPYWDADAFTPGTKYLLVGRTLNISGCVAYKQITSEVT
ncbi:unnamed protein product [Penicillium camemberti]|uniref:Str. FM013 n=1 Tax=Penicillium camemberti (strain FM 013) TaxID=1429867 RepID=A0A0G4NXK9_PENC3|nr:unnamed protein product [Penicillium camemberti]